MSHMEVLPSITVTWPKGWGISRKHLVIYISAPLSVGEPTLNIRRACFAGDAVLAKGHTPYIPHLNYFWDLISPKSYETYMEIDCALLAKCDGVLRLDGYSVGADREVAEAKRLGLPVYYNISEVPNG